MKKIKDVNLGKIEVTRDHVILRAMALGSCIGVAAYDHRSQIAGMAHVMLPGRAPEGAVEKTRYAFDAISHLLSVMIDNGARRTDTACCLVGAGNVLQKADDTICDSNITSVIETLSREDIPVRATLLGGIMRKTISLDVQIGLVYCSEGDGKEELLWDFSSRRS